MANRFKKSKWYHRYYKVMCLGLFVIVFIALSVFIIYKGFDIVKSRDITYVNNSNIDYKVYLKENTYYEVPYLGKNDKYITSLIDKVNINYNYTLSNEEEMSGKYKYHLVAELIVKEQNKDSVLWKKSFDLTNEESISFKNQKTIEVNEDVSINYDYYNEMAASFKKDYGVLTDSFLNVKLVVSTDFDKVSDDFVVEKEPYVVIPLGEKTIEIESYDLKDDSDVLSVSYTKYPILNYSLIALGVIFVIIYLILGIKVIIRFARLIKNKNKYEAFIVKIFDNYDQIIVISDKLPNLDGVDVLDVNDFDDLIDAQLEVHKPIIFSEISKNKKAVFVLVDDKHGYRYTVKQEDFK